MAAPADQSTSSVTRSRMAWTSPRPNASYICRAVAMFCPALMIVPLPFQEPGQAQNARARGVAGELLDGAHPAAVHGHEHDLRAVHRAPVGAQPYQDGHVALAAGHDRLRPGAQRAGGEQRGSVR
jgi:hypothetical protein